MMLTALIYHLLIYSCFNIIVYAPPAHTSGRTQPLDVVVFSVFKPELNKVMNSVSTREEGESWDVFKLCMLIRHAHETALSGKNIKAAFCRAGLWPLDSRKLLSVPRPAAPDSLEKILDKGQLADLFEKKRAVLREKFLGEEAVLQSKGYVDTTCGQVLTLANAMNLIEAHVNRKRRATASAKLVTNQKELVEQRKVVAGEKMRVLLQEFVELRRAKQYGESIETYRNHVRPLGERRASAKLNAAHRTHDAATGGGGSSE